MLEPLDRFDGITINLELTSLCNFHCPYCYERKKVKYNRFFTQHQIRVIDQALGQSHYPVRLYLLGGEPYLYPYLSEAVRLFKANPRIKDLAIFSNGSFPERILPAKHFLSWHSSQVSCDAAKLKFIESARKCPECRVRILLDNPERCREAETFIREHLENAVIEPTYLYCPTSEYNPDTRRVQLRPRVLDCENVLEFILDGKKVTRREVIEHFNPRGCLCVQERFCINNVGNICLGCGAAIDNIFRNPSFFRDYRLVTKVCSSSVCAKDMFLEQRKLATDNDPFSRATRRVQK